MKTFFAVKKPIAVQFYDPLKMTDEELKEIGVFKKEEPYVDYSIGYAPLFIGTLENPKYEFTARTHLIVKGIKGEMYAIERIIFEETYIRIISDNEIKLGDDLTELLKEYN